MPLFFDLNLPYSASASAGGGGGGGNRDSRLRAVVSLLELGYSGAAYNLSLRGVLSDKNRCAIAPFPLSSLLAAAPSLAASASFHCILLGSAAAAGSAFRQFSRVTVSVDTAAAAGSVGSTAAVLRGYDVVAVRPVSQSAFEHVCKFSQVDLISIDFSQKVPFRLRYQSVELAIKRGIYFEITYSHLLSDNTNIKKQMLSDAKMLADWTKGKNLIISSGASNANEIRGPKDVSNLISFLLGISKERAKAAISDNCRSVLAKALRKQHFYKETIRIERMPTNQSELKNPFSVGDWINWDPLSSEKGGDLPSLDEISKGSSNPKNRNATDFESVFQEKPFLLSQHASKLDEIKLASGNREVVLKERDFENDDITLVSGGFDHSGEISKVSSNPKNRNATDFESVLKKKPFLLSQHAVKLDEIKVASGNREETKSDEMQLDDQEEVRLKERDFENDDITLVSGGFDRSDEISKVSSSVSPNPSNPKNRNATDFESVVQEKPFLLSQHAGKLDEIKLDSGNREETKSDEMQLDDDQEEVRLKERDFENDDITLVSGGFDHSDEISKFSSSSVSPNPPNPKIGNATDFESVFQGKPFLLSQHAVKLDEIKLDSGNREETKADEMQLDEQEEVMLKERDFENDDITLVSGGFDHSDEFSKVSSSSESPNPSNPKNRNATDFESVVQEKPFLLSQHGGKLDEIKLDSGNREETKADEMQLGDDSKNDDITLVSGGFDHSDGFVHNKTETPVKDYSFEKDNTSSIGSEFEKDHNAPEAVVGISDGTEATMEEKSLLNNLMDEVYTDTKKIDQMKDKEEVEGDILKINLIYDEDKKSDKFKIIKLGDNKETVDVTSSSTKGKRKQKGLPLLRPCTMSFKRSLKNMLFKKKSKR